MTMTIEKLESAARRAHLENWADRTDGYATPEEMQMHLNDPLAELSLIEEQLIDATGYTIQGGKPVQMHWNRADLGHDYCTITRSRGIEEYTVANIVDGILPLATLSTLSTAQAYANVVVCHAIDCGY